MSYCTKLLLTLGLMAITTLPVSAQNILLKDGKTIVSKGLRRQGDIIMATVDIPIPALAGKPARVQVGEIGYSLSVITKLDFPEPPQLYTVPELIATGKLPEALAQIEPIVRFYESFRDAPGSWWEESLLLKIEALQAMGNFKDADPLIDNLSRVATAPETVRAAKVFVAAKLTRRGDYARALEMFNQVMKESTKPMTLATASVNMGQSYLGLKQYESALLAFLQIPVFYPRQKMLLTQSILGCARAYYGMENLPKAKSTLEDLIKDYASAPQVADAKEELEKIAKREKALAEPK